MIRKATFSDLAVIKELVDAHEELVVDADTFSLAYFARILKKGILLVAEDAGVVGVCFGTYNSKEDWADLVGVVVKEDYRNKGIGVSLVRSFEMRVKELNISSIDLYAISSKKDFFSSLGYEKGRTYVAFHKKIKK